MLPVLACLLSEDKSVCNSLNKYCKKNKNPLRLYLINPATTANISDQQLMAMHI